MTTRIEKILSQKRFLNNITSLVKTSTSLLALVCVLNINAVAMDLEEGEKLNTTLSIAQQMQREEATHSDNEYGVYLNLGREVCKLAQNLALLSSNILDYFNFTKQKNNLKRKKEGDKNKKDSKKQKLDPNLEIITEAPFNLTQGYDNANIDESIAIGMYYTQEPETNPITFLENKRSFAQASLHNEPEEKNTNPKRFKISHGNEAVRQAESPLHIKDLRIHKFIPLLDAQSFGRWRRVCKNWDVEGQEYVDQFPKGSKLINVLAEKNFEEVLLYLANYSQYSITSWNEFHDAAQAYFGNEIKVEDKLFEIDDKTDEFIISRNFLNSLEVQNNMVAVDQELERRINIYAPYGVALLFASRLSLLLHKQRDNSLPWLQKAAIENLFDPPIGHLTVRHPLLNKMFVLINSDTTYFQSYKILEVMKGFSKLKISSSYDTKLRREIKSYANAYNENAGRKDPTGYARAGQLFELQMSGIVSPSATDCKSCAGAYQNAADYFQDNPTKSFFYAKAAEFYEKKLHLPAKIVARDYRSCADAYQNASSYVQDTAIKIRHYIKGAEMLGEQLKMLGGKATAEDCRECTKMQANIGYRYYYGQGVKKDYVEAKKWYQLAAIHNHANAQNGLGCLLHSNGAYAEAMEFFQLAAAQNHVSAQRNVGLCYQRGLGVEKNDIEAIKWYRLAADQGDTDARKNLKKLENTERFIDLSS